MNPNNKYVFDEDELVFTGKQMREYRDICRIEGYKQALEDVLNLPIRDFVGDYIRQIEKLKMDLKGAKE